MPTRRINKGREHRIEQQVVVDAYNEGERAMGWYYYLADRMEFPFKAKCICKKSTSPLTKGEIVEVKAMSPENVCGHDMFVEIRFNGRKLAVPLSQLKGIGINDETQQVITDWHYWVDHGYDF